MLIESLDKDKFKTPGLADAVEKLLILEPKFVDKRSANSLAGHLLSLASVFKEDSTVITALLQSNGGPRRAGAKVIPMKTVVKKKTTSFKYDSSGNCINCPKTTVSPPINAGSKADTAEPDESQKAGGAPTTLTELSTMNVKSWRDIANIFETDPDVMKAFMQMNGITVGNTVAEAGLAKKIFKALIDEGTD
jgi:hypothetical protein